MNRGLDLIGRQIGVYRIEELIGAGGYSRVYRALDKTVGRMAAIKILLPSTGEDGYSERVIQRFEREARIVANLRDPHSVLLYEYGQTDDGLLYMIFEYIEGHTLEEMRRQQFALPALRVIKILEQILLSLEEAHALGLIHRDIKPANIMVFEHIGRTDQVKVLDFGVGKAFGTHPEASNLTQTGMLIGTPRYMAPEQWSTEGVISPQTDIYSLGLVTYELITGVRAITAVDPVHIMTAHLNSEPIALPSDLDIPSGLRHIVNTMLHKERGARYRTVTQILADLLRLKPVAAESSTMLLSKAKLRGDVVEPTLDPAADAQLVDAPKTETASTREPAPIEARPAHRESDTEAIAVPKRRCAKTIRIEPEAQRTLTSARPQLPEEMRPPETPTQPKPPKTKTPSARAAARGALKPESPKSPRRKRIYLALGLAVTTSAIACILALIVTLSAKDAGPGAAPTPTDPASAGSTPEKLATSGEEQEKPTRPALAPKVVHDDGAPAPTPPVAPAGSAPKPPATPPSFAPAHLEQPTLTSATPPAPQPAPETETKTSENRPLTKSTPRAEPESTQRKERAKQPKRAKKKTPKEPKLQIWGIE